MPKIRVTEADRQTYGLPEVMEYDLVRPRLSEVRELKRQVGLNFGEFVDIANDPNDIDYATGVVVWLAAIRAGVKIPFEEFDLDTRGVEFEKDEGEEDPNSLAPDGATNS